jgi:hypothetical protein
VRAAGGRGVAAGGYRGDEMMQGAVDSVIVRENNDNVTLRARRAYAHRPCRDKEDVSVTPVPSAVPGEFVVRLLAVVSGETLRGLEAGMAALGGVVLSLLDWIEVEIRGFPDLFEELGMLRGAVMAVGVTVEGEPSVTVDSHPVTTWQVDGCQECTSDHALQGTGKGFKGRELICFRD